MDEKDNTNKEKHHRRLLRLLAKIKVAFKRNILVKFQPVLLELGPSVETKAPKLLKLLKTRALKEWWRVEG